MTTAKITSRQKQQAQKLVGDALTALKLSKDSMQRVLESKEFQSRFKQIVMELAVDQSSEYFTSIPDVQVPAKYQLTLAKYRKLATEWGVPTTTAVCYHVGAGFTLKSHAPKAGPCYDKFSYLQSWNFPDEPTKHCLVFWIPRLAPNSTNKTYVEQITLLSELRTHMELPKHHMSSLGNVALNAGLILAHYKATNERVPLDGFYIRTDTCDAGGRRLNLGVFGGDGLDCDAWDFDGSRGGDLGVLVSGVELGS